MNCSNLSLVTKKLAFLLSLGSVARISELTAFGRGEEYLEFSSDGSVKISMLGIFLAKNEDPDNRWAPFHIPPLPEFPELCPVTTLKRFLELSKHFAGGQLFRCETTGRNISKSLLGTKLSIYERC